MTTDNKNTAEKEIVITRDFDASRDNVWSAWTEPEKIEQWFGPRGFRTRVDEMSFEAGGTWTYVMLDKDDNEYPSVGMFKEIVEPERIVSTDDFGDSQENENAAPEGLPTGMVVTTSFEEQDSKTRLEIKISHQSVEDRIKHEEMGVVDGWNESLDKLAEYLGIS